MHYSLGEQVNVTWAIADLNVVHLQPVAIGEHNACQVDVSVASTAVTGFDVEHQVSHDLENWTLPSSSSPWKQTVNTNGAQLLQKVTGITAPYLRVVLKAGFIGLAYLMIGINFSKQ